MVVLLYLGHNCHSYRAYYPWSYESHLEYRCAEIYFGGWLIDRRPLLPFCRFRTLSHGYLLYVYERTVRWW